ncbi:unnamed protein product [Gadus morhua 'NCC']
MTEPLKEGLFASSVVNRLPKGTPMPSRREALGSCTTPPSRSELRGWVFGRQQEGLFLLLSLVATPTPPFLQGGIKASLDVDLITERRY